MAVTFAASSLTRDVQGSKRAHRALLTLTGTYTAGGDTVAASLFGLAVIENLQVESALSDAQANPTSLDAIPVKQADGTWKLAVSCNVVGAVNTTTVAAGKTVALAAGQTLTNYTIWVEAIGR